jgi:hypothetical protein
MLCREKRGDEDEEKKKRIYNTSVNYVSRNNDENEEKNKRLS